jgi:hypothetical protein
MVLAAALLVCWPLRTADAKVFYARDEMMELAFADADNVTARDFFLTPEQRRAIEQQAQSALESDLLSVYTGWRDGRLLGYAIVDTHVVRTLPETFLVVLTPGGEIAATHVLAFYEPLDYLPSSRWLGQFEGRRLDEHFRIGDEIAAITGSTLSSRAVVGGVRRALAAYRVLIAPTSSCDSSSQGSGPETACSR